MDAKWLEDLASLGTGGVVAAAVIWYYHRHVVQTQARIDAKLTELLQILQGLDDQLK